MPEISRFFGIIIYMYRYDHAPPHIHFTYGEFEGIIYISSGVIEGRAPAKVVKRVLKWWELHKEELMALWEKAQQGEELYRISPLT